MYDSPCMTWTVYWTLNLRRLHTLIISALFTGYPECLPPAPIISLNSDSDSALPTLCLKLVFEFCLSDLHFVLLKPHMDPHASDSASQEQSRCRETARERDYYHHIRAAYLPKFKLIQPNFMALSKKTNIQNDRNSSKICISLSQTKTVSQWTKRKHHHFFHVVQSLCICNGCVWPWCQCKPHSPDLK